MVRFLMLLALPLASVANAELAPLTIGSAVQNALDRNPTVLSAREAVVQARATKWYAISKVFPTIYGEAEALRSKASATSSSPLFGGRPYNVYDVTLYLSQPIYDGSVSGGLRYAAKGITLQENNVAIQERTLTLQVLETFYNVLLQQRRLQILNDTYSVDRDTLAIAERYFRIGRAQKLDVLQLKTQTSLLQPKIAQTDDAMRTSAAQLAQQLRILDTKSIRVKGDLASPPYAWVKEMVAQKRMKELPEISQARTTVDQFEDQRDVTMASFWPKLNLTGQIGRSAYSKVDLIDQNSNAWSVGLVLTVPIFNGFGSIFERRSLASQEQQLEYAETKVSDSVSVSQIQTERDLEAAQAQLASSLEAAEYGRESLKEAQREYKLQTINYLQYQSSQQAYLDSETGYYQAQYDYIDTVAKYFIAMGVPLELLVDKLESMTAK